MGSGVLGFPTTTIQGQWARLTHSTRPVIESFTRAVADVCTTVTGSGWSVAMGHMLLHLAVIECVAQYGWPRALFG